MVQAMVDNLPLLFEGKGVLDLFAAADKNKSGELDREEYVKAIQSRPDILAKFHLVGFDDDKAKRVKRHPKYKTKICTTFTETGRCPYGDKCAFIHQRKEDNMDVHFEQSGECMSTQSPHDEIIHKTTTTAQ